VSATVAATDEAVATPSTSPVPATAGSPGAAGVEIPDDDDVPLLSWDQWASALAPAFEASAGALMARSDAGAALGHPADGVGPSSSRAGPSACLE
jgi:hypothetical protein